MWDLSWEFKIDGSFCKVYVVFSVDENVWSVSCIEQSVFFSWLLCNKGSVVSSFMVWCVQHPLTTAKTIKNQWNLVPGKLSHCRVENWWGHSDCLNCPVLLICYILLSDDWSSMYSDGIYLASGPVWQSSQSDSKGSSATQQFEGLFRSRG